MRRSIVLVVAILAAMAGFVGFSNPAQAEGRPFTVTLTGAAEAPGPGDPDATGTASITLNQGLGEVCFDLTWSDIDGTVTASHIHAAPPGVAGPVVVTLFATSLPGTGGTSDCVSADKDLIKDIRQNPENYYVNVHSTEFPAGAIRAQLG